MTASVESWRFESRWAAGISSSTTTNIMAPAEVAHGSLRLSLCEWNTQEDVDHILKEVPRIVAYLRSISPVWKDLTSGKKQFML